MKLSISSYHDIFDNLQYYYPLAQYIHSLFYLPVGNKYSAVAFSCLLVRDVVLIFGK